MAHKSIGRRALLRGLGGVAIALPALEIMRPFGGKSASAAGGTVPKRYAFFYAAHAIGGHLYAPSVDGKPDHGVPNILVPAATGANYALTPGLMPLGSSQFDVKGDVSVVSGLKIPWAVNGIVPAGGRCIEFHYGPSVVPQLTGVRHLARYDNPTAPSSDQIVADANAQGTRLRSLSYLVQAADYENGSSGSGGRASKIAWQKKGGKVVGLDAVTSPRLAYETLFTGFSTNVDPADAKKAAALLARRKSVLDLVRANSEKLLPQLGKADAQRLAQHFDEIRALETRLDAVDGPASAACKQPASPVDPPFTPAQRQSNEELRAELFGDLLHMAFVCDLTRVAAYQFMHWKSYMSMAFIGINQDAHDVSHDYHVGGPEKVGKVLAWQVKHFARITKKLKDTKDVDGTTLLDNTAMVMVFEGGQGYDPEQASGPRTGNEFSVHSTENMAALVAGRAGGLKPGKHIVATDKHPANVVLSAMTAVGVPNGGSLGEVAGTIPALFT